MSVTASSQRKLNYSARVTSCSNNLTFHLKYHILAKPALLRRQIITVRRWARDSRFSSRGMSVRKLDTERGARSHLFLPFLPHTEEIYTYITLTKRRWRWAVILHYDYYYDVPSSDAVAGTHMQPREYNGAGTSSLNAQLGSSEYLIQLEGKS